MRQVGYSLRNERPTNPDSVDSLLAFAIGRAAENEIAKALETVGAGVLREVRLEIPTASTVVSGRVDFLFEIPGLVSTIIELKTINSRAMAKMLEAGRMGQDGHRHQLNLYLHAAQLGLLPKTYDTGYLVYWVKDTIRGEPSIFAWEQLYDASMALDDLRVLDSIAEGAKVGLLPNRPYATKAWQCSYCEFEATCWKS